jgi:hypothetical protein
MKVKYLLIGILFLSACNGRLDEMRPIIWQRRITT